MTGGVPLIYQGQCAGGVGVSGTVQARPGNKPLVLKPADNDTGSNSLLVGKCPDSLLAEQRCGNEWFPSTLRDDGVGRPLVGLSFQPGGVSATFVNKNAFLAVKKNVRGFMEEAEPVTWILHQHPIPGVGSSLA